MTLVVMYEVWLVVILCKNVICQHVTCLYEWMSARVAKLSLNFKWAVKQCGMFNAVIKVGDTVSEFFFYALSEVVNTICGCRLIVDEEP